ncbi:MAG: CBS domain-containing protein [bacterium]|nr:CBS domain-containing protein [bacterium]
MQVANIMTRDPLTIAPDATLDEAIGRMDEHQIRHLPVVEDGSVVGVVSDRDLLERTGWLPARVRDIYQGPVESRGACVRDVMLAPIECATPDAPLGPLLESARSRQLECVPVVDGDRLVGIVTEKDVLGAFAERCRDAKTEPGAGEDPRVDDIMAKDVHVLEVGATLARAREEMARAGAHHLPVIQGGRLVGIVSDRDLRRAAGRGRGEDYVIEEVMTRAVVGAPRDMRLSEAILRMLAGRFSSLPVVEGSQIVGILTFSDALQPCLAALEPAQ